MSQPTDRDDELLAELYREGRREEPPAALDAAILAAAAAHRPWYRRTAIAGLASAAVIVLAVAVVLINPGAEQTNVVDARDLESVADRDATMELRQRAVPPAAVAARSRAPASQGALAAPGARAELSAAPEPQSGHCRQTVTVGAGPDAVYQLCFDTVEVSVTAAACARPYQLPHGTTVLAADEGVLAVTADGARSRLQCRDGDWITTPAGSASPPAPTPP